MECYTISAVDKAPKTGIIKSKRPERKEKKMARYSKEFKAEALKLSDELGVKKAARS